MIHCNRIKNRITQLSACLKMSVGGRGLVAYRLDQVAMFIHVYLSPNAVYDWKEELEIETKQSVSCSFLNCVVLSLK